MPVTINGTTGVSTPGAVLDNTTLLSAGTGTITFPAATGTVLLSGGSSAIPASGATGQIPVYTGATTIAGSFAPVIGVAGSQAGTIGLCGSTSGTTTLQASAIAGTTTATFPARTANVMLDGPAFSAYLSSDQSITNSTWTKVAFNTEEYDTNNNFAGGRFTPTVPGYYQISSVVDISPTTFSTTSSGVAIYKNGSPYKYGNILNFSSGIQGGSYMQISSLVFLNGSTDYVEIYGFGTASSALTFAGISSYTWVNGYLSRGI